MSHLYFGHDIYREPQVISSESLAQKAVQHIPGAQSIVKTHFSNNQVFRDVLPPKPINALMYEPHPAH